MGWSRLKREGGSELLDRHRIALGLVPSCASCRVRYLTTTNSLLGLSVCRSSPRLIPTYLVLVLWTALGTGFHYPSCSLDKETWTKEGKQLAHSPWILKISGFKPGAVAWEQLILPKLHAEVPEMMHVHSNWHAGIQQVLNKCWISVFIPILDGRVIRTPHEASSGRSGMWVPREREDFESVF